MRYDATRKYHEFLGAITQHAAEGILAFNRSGLIILSNPAADQIFNYHPEKVEGLNISELIAEEDYASEKWAALFEQLDQADQSSRAPTTMTAKRSDDAPLPIEIAIGKAVLSDGEVIYIANCRDISRRLEVEGKLRRQAEIIAQMQDGMIVADLDHTILECNSVLAEMIGLPREEIINCRVGDVAVLRFDESVDPERILRAAKQHGQWNGVVDITTGEEDTVKADVLVFPVVEPDGSTVFTIMIRDITDRHEAESRIVQTQKIEALGRLAGGVAHDINNLLFPIFMNLESALETVEEYPDLRETYEEISASMQACTKMKVMLQHVLHFSRKNSVEVEDLDISGVVEEAWGLASMLVPSSIKKTVAIEEDVGTVQANSVQISQMVLNLVSNAVAAMDGQNGELSISLRRARPTGKNLGKYYNVDEREAVELVISDTGCGIRKEHLKKIFDPFFTTKEVGQGTGLGLTEVAGIIRSLRGGMDVESCPDDGTVFTVFLPIKEVALAAE